MKLKFLLSLTSIALLSSPAKAIKAEPSQKIDIKNLNIIADKKLTQLPPLPAINFIPPEPEIEFTPLQPKTNPINNPTNVNDSLSDVIPSGKQMLTLNAQIRALMNRYRFLSPGMFFVDLQTGDYLDINGNKAFPAASTIKFPILIALFQEIDAGRIRLDEPLVMQRNLVAGGSGDMQYKSIGRKYTVLQTATKMMTISDNTATNMIIQRLGGKAVLNQRFRSWGLKNTAIRNLLADVNGTNTVSPKDLVQLSALVVKNKLISDNSRSQVLEMMRRCRNKTMLPAGLGTGAMISHKTGTLRFVLGDAGIIQMPSGKMYLAGIIVKRPNHDKRATVFIRKVSQLVYSYEENLQLSNLP